MTKPLESVAVPEPVVDDIIYMTGMEIPLAQAAVEAYSQALRMQARLQAEARATLVKRLGAIVYEHDIDPIMEKDVVSWCFEKNHLVVKRG